MSKILFPAALVLIMLGLGMTLTVADFTRLTRMPRSVLIGLLGHTCSYCRWWRWP